MNPAPRPVLQAHISGRTVLLTRPDGTQEQHAAGGRQDARAVTVTQVRNIAAELEQDVELLTSGDRGEHHLLVRASGEISAVELEPIATPAPAVQMPSPLVDTSGEGPHRFRTTWPLVDEHPSAPSELPSISDADTLHGFTFDEVDESTVMVRRRPRAKLTLDDGSVLVVTGSTTIGRRPSDAAPQAGLVDDPTATLSRRHVLVELVDGCFVVSDLGSMNGTAITRGGYTAELEPHRPFALAAGDRLILGDRTVTVDLEGMHP